MKLDRNIKKNKGKGKYALIKLRELKLPLETTADKNIVMVPVESVDYGEPTAPGNDFFVIRLRDQFAAWALTSYAAAARKAGMIEYSNEIMELAIKASHHPQKKKPD